MIHPGRGGQDVGGAKVFVGEGKVISVGIWTMAAGDDVMVTNSIVLVEAGASGK